MQLTTTTYDQLDVHDRLYDNLFKKMTKMIMLMTL